MSELTRENAYRRWKKGEDPHKLAKEIGTTRERMSHILKKMDASVPLVDRIEELEAKLSKSEALLARAVEALERIEDASKYFGNCPEASETTVRYAHETTRRLCRTTLAELKGQDDE